MHLSHPSFFQQCNAFHIVDFTLYALYHCYAYVIAYMYLTEHKEVSFGKIKSDIFSNGRALLLFQCWASVEDSGPTLKPHWGMLRISGRFELLESGIIIHCTQMD